MYRPKCRLLTAPAYFFCAWRCRRFEITCSLATDSAHNATELCGLSAAVPRTDRTSVAPSHSPLGHAITSASVEAHDAGAWAKLLHVQRAQNFWADDQTVREFIRFAINRWNLLHNRLLCTASTSPRRRLICASRFNSINSAAGGVCRARWVSEGLDRGLEVGMLPRLRIKIWVLKNDITKLKPKICHLSYSTLRQYAANCVTVKPAIVDMGVIADAKRQARMKCAFKIVGFAHHC